MEPRQAERLRGLAERRGITVADLIEYLIGVGESEPPSAHLARDLTPRKTGIPFKWIEDSPVNPAPLENF